VEKFDREFVIRQVFWSDKSGDTGDEVLYPHRGDPGIGFPFPLSLITGRPLGTGTRVRVTVEVLEERPLRKNPYRLLPPVPLNPPWPEPEPKRRWWRSRRQGRRLED
jgi:hypothetical protein